MLSKDANWFLIPGFLMPQLLLTALFIGQAVVQPLGQLVIAGGGPTTPEITDKALSLAGGKKAHVLIIPQASARVDAGQRSEQLWRKAGAEHVGVLDFKDRKAALAAIKQADLIWMPGGSQSRLMKILCEQGVVEAIRDRFRHGATVGGTSAGAAVMSMLMLTGDAKVDRVVADNTKMAEGLGLWPDVIVDQHYLSRGRFNRLLCAVLNHPQNVGIGIDESTAVVVKGRFFEVVGKSNVIVIDARKAKKIQSKNGEPGAAANISLQVLKAGMKFDLDRGVLLSQ
jgi:cyanophycinase